MHTYNVTEKFYRGNEAELSGLTDNSLLVMLKGMKDGGTVSGTKRRKIALLVTGVVLLVGVAIVVTLLMTRDKKPTDQEVSQRIIKEVSEIYVVPANESPTVAAVQDVSKLPKQEFFNNAQTGDYLLVYPKAKLALLYRDSIDKLVNVGPINQPASPKTGQ